VSARNSLGHPQDERQERSQRRWPQVVAAKGYRPRARWLDSVAFVAPWRHGSRTEAPRLQLRIAEENVARRAALGLVGKARRTETDRCRCSPARNAQEQGFARDARQVERPEVGV